MGLLSWLKNRDAEGDKIVSFISNHATASPRILDVGCGYGRNLSRLCAQGWDALGVEKNSRIALENKKNKLPCIAPEELAATQGKFDVLLFSHVVEHFSPDDLLKFLNHYLEFVKSGGIVIIATPMMSAYFYDDFDHIRPYHPESFLLAFGGSHESQMQYHGRASLELVDIWYRRSPLRFNHCRGRHVPGFSRKLFAFANLILLGLHIASVRLIGRTDGWVGTFRCRPIRSGAEI